MSSFDNFGLHPALIKAIDRLSFREPTPVQAAVIPLALAGRDIQAGAETGSGKSAAFFLPILHRMLSVPSPNTATRCLVLSPTRELAQQLYNHCVDLARFSPVKALVLQGGENFREQRAWIRKNPEIIIGTPGRVLEHMTKKSLDLSDLECLVLDEADRMLDMGFQEEVLEIVAQCAKPRQSMLFSATLDHQAMGAVCTAVLDKPEAVTLGSHRSPHRAITQEIVLADDPGHKQQLSAWLLSHEDFNKALVFTNTRDRAESLTAFLQKQGVRAACLHGELSQEARRQVMDLFRRGRVSVLVATDLAARGLDIAGVQLVINYAMARSGDDYVHRIGRTGRAGEQGKAISLISPQEWNLMCSIERYLNLAFDRRVIRDLPARFSGPTRKSAKSKRKSPEKPAPKKPGEKAKQRHRNRKNIGKRRKPVVNAGDGLAPLKKRD